MDDIKAVRPARDQRPGSVRTATLLAAMVVLQGCGAAFKVMMIGTVEPNNRDLPIHGYDIGRIGATFDLAPGPTNACRGSDGLPGESFPENAKPPCHAYVKGDACAHGIGRVSWRKVGKGVSGEVWCLEPRRTDGVPMHPIRPPAAHHVVEIDPAWSFPKPVKVLSYGSDGYERDGTLQRRAARCEVDADDGTASPQGCGLVVGGDNVCPWGLSIVTWIRRPGGTELYVACQTSSMEVILDDEPPDILDTDTGEASDG